MNEYYEFVIEHIDDDLRFPRNEIGRFNFGEQLRIENEP